MIAIRSIFSVFFALFLCLQYSIVLDDSAVLDDSHTVVVEFKQAFEFRLSENTRKYPKIYLKEDVLASEEEVQDYWTVDSKSLRGIKSDIDYTFVENVRGVWKINIVFDRQFSHEIVEMGWRHLGNDLGVILNSHLISVPRVEVDSFSRLTPNGQYLLSIPTQFRSQDAVERFMDSYNI